MARGPEASANVNFKMPFPRRAERNRGRVLACGIVNGMFWIERSETSRFSVFPTVPQYVEKC
jgi:hypothetical protein